MAVVDPPVTPTPDLLGNHAARHLAGLALIALAAVLVHRAGFIDQRWQYAAMAAALAPQVLIDMLGARDRVRRSRLRVSRRPVLLLACLALLLGGVAVYAATTQLPVPVVAAAALGSLGLGVAAAPPSIHVTRRR